MTPEQLQALESVRGSALTQDQIDRAEAFLAERNDVELARIVSEGRTKLKSHLIGVGTILGAFAGKGGEFLDTLATIGQSNRDVYWLLESNIKRGAFDIGEPASRAGMQAMAAQLPEYAAGIAALLALGVEPDPVHYNRVSDALNVAEGRMTL